MPVRAIQPPHKPSAWSDRLLLKRVLERNESAWAEMVRRYRALIYRCITKVTFKYAAELTSTDLDEIYADVLMSLFRNNMHKLRQYDPDRRTKLGSWIGLISINAAHDYLRSAGRVPMLDRIDGNQEGRETTDRTPLDDLIEKERWAQLNGILAGFSSKDRDFLELYYGRGLDAAAVADKMSITLKTVYSKKHKIRAHLLRCLEDQLISSPIADLASLAA